jgi:flagellar protein FlbD
MILLHRLGRDRVPFHLNSDLIVSIEANPDTVLHLATGVNLVVAETPEEVVAEVRSWRRSINPIHAATSPPGRTP